MRGLTEKGTGRFIAIAPRAFYRQPSLRWRTVFIIVFAFLVLYILSEN